MSSSPCAIKILLTTKDSVLALSTEKGFVLPVFLSKGREFPQESAKRVLKTVFGLENSSFVSLPLVTRIGLEEIPEEEKKLWPKGIRTIPVVSFHAEVQGESLKLFPGCSWLPKKEASFLLGNKEDRDLLGGL